MKQQKCNCCGVHYVCAWHIHSEANTEYYGDIAIVYYLECPNCGYKHFISKKEYLTILAGK